MFFELIGTLLAGVAAGLIVWAVGRFFKGGLPKWLMPVAAGAAMLLATISNEYSWFNRTAATMPEGMVVAQTIEDTAFFRPWTYALPFVSRFVAVDQATARTHPDQPGQRLVDLVFYGRWARPAKVPMLFDCTNNKRADVVDGVDFGDDGGVLNVDWRGLPADDPILKAACMEV